jgi:hypothetical protein
MDSLGRVLDFGEGNIGPLVAALNHKHANPVAKALGLMMSASTAEQEIPPLLDWLIVQSPLYPDVLEALVRAGEKPVPFIVQRLGTSAAENDDEAVRNLLDLGCRLSDSALRIIVPAIVDLLRHENPHIQETAADAIWRIGLPHGIIAEADLQRLAKSHAQLFVRDAAREALIRLGGGKPN